MIKIKPNYLPILLGYISFSCLTQFDLFSPSLPMIEKEFSVHTTKLHLLITISTFFYSFFMLIGGCFEKKISSKKILLAGLSIFLIGSIVCYFSNNYYILLLGRAIQGIGMVGPTVASVSIINKVFSISEQRIALSHFSATIAFGYLIAPSVGVFLSSVAPWHDDFLVGGLSCFFCLIMTYFFIPNFSETTKNENLFQNFNLINSYRPIFRNDIFYYLVINSSLASCSRVFLMMAPILFLKTIHVSHSTYLMFIAIMSVFYVLLNSTLGIVLKIFGTKKSQRVSFFTYIIFFLYCFILIIFEVKNAYFFMIIMPIISIINIYISNNFYTLAINVVSGTAARVKSISSFITALFTVSGVQIIGIFDDTSFSPTLIFMILFAGIGVSMAYLASKKPGFYDIWDKKK